MVFDPEDVVAHTARVHVELARGEPRSAVAAMRVQAPVSRIWALVEQVERFDGFVPMLHQVRRQGDVARIGLRFKIALFSVGFEFKARVTQEPQRWLELSWLDGEPRDLRLRFDLRPLGEAETLLHTTASFDVNSLGWLAKYFLKHHPEIKYGVFPGVAVALADSVRKAVEGR